MVLWEKMPSFAFLWLSVVTYSVPCLLSGKPSSFEVSICGWLYSWLYSESHVSAIDSTTVQPLKTARLSFHRNSASQQAAASTHFLDKNPFLP